MSGFAQAMARLDHNFGLCCQDKWPSPVEALEALGIDRAHVRWRAALKYRDDSNAEAVQSFIVGVAKLIIWDRALKTFREQAHPWKPITAFPNESAWSEYDAERMAMLRTCFFDAELWFSARVAEQLESSHE